MRRERVSEKFMVRPWIDGASPRKKRLRRAQGGDSMRRPQKYMEVHFQEGGGQEDMMGKC